MLAMRGASRVAGSPWQKHILQNSRGFGASGFRVYCFGFGVCGVGL